MTKSDWKIVLSYGGGVNSTAIIALSMLGEIPKPDYIVFSDTGAEHYHTYSYIDYIEKQGVNLIYLTGGTKEMTLIEYCQLKNFIPSRMNRWCTDYWKVSPVGKFAKAIGEDVIIWIGIDAGEAYRAERKLNKRKEFPLIELGLDRNACKKVIRQAGLGVPMKSGCFICPYQKRREWIDLRKNHPDYWKVAVDLEKQSMSKHENFTYITGCTIEDYVSDSYKQDEFEFPILDQRCECYFD